MTMECRWRPVLCEGSGLNRKKVRFSGKIGVVSTLAVSKTQAMRVISYVMHWSVQRFVFDVTRVVRLP